MSDQLVRYETDEKVSIITLDRADKLNAINSLMKDQIIAALARADKDAATSVVVLRAEGRSFSAGFDLGHSPDRGQNTGAADPNTWDPILHRSFDFGMAPWSTTKPVIASVQGHVLGGGCELTLMCDLTIAADDAKFGEPEVRFSHLGPLMVMPWFIGLKRARELLLFGDMIDAKTALEFGMINRIVPAAELRTATMKYAKRLSLIAPEALRWGKRVINRSAEIGGMRTAIEAGVDFSCRSMRRRPKSAANSAAVSAMMVSRPRSNGVVHNSRSEKQSHENRRSLPYHEHPHARLGRLRRQQDVLRAKSADADDRGAASRDLDALRHAFRRRHACDRRPHRRHGLAADGLSGQPRRRRRPVEAGHDWTSITPEMIENAGAEIREGDILILYTGWYKYYEGQAQQDLVRYFCYHPGPNLATLEWMLKKKIKWFGMDTGSCDHPMNTSIRNMRPDIAREFEQRMGKSAADYFGTFEYVHKRSGRKVRQDTFPFHNYAFQEGLLHAENLGGDLELVLGKRCIIGAFPWRYEGLEACPCRILAIFDAGSDAVEALGDAAKGIVKIA